MMTGEFSAVSKPVAAMTGADCGISTPSSLRIGTPALQTLPIMVPTIGQQFPLPSTCPASAVEQALRTLLSSIPRESLVSIFKNILEDTTSTASAAVMSPKRKKKKKSWGNTTPITPVATSAEAYATNPTSKSNAASDIPELRQHGGAEGMMVSTDSKETASGADGGAHAGDTDGAQFTTVTYKKKKGKRARVEPSATTSVGVAAKPRQKRFIEYKIRLTRTQTSIKPLLPQLKSMITAQNVTAAFTMHFIEKANTISVRTDSEDVAKSIQKIREVAIQGQSTPVQVFRTYGATYCKGVIYDIYTLQEDPQDEVLNLELESEKNDVVAARRLGKTTTAVLTFDSDKIPRSVLYGRRYMRVFPYKPKAVTCTNCHRLGHKPDICPNAPVCDTCGNIHANIPKSGSCSSPAALFCQGCRKAGHIGTDRACPTWVETNKRIREEVKKHKDMNKIQQKQAVAAREVKVPLPPSATWADRMKYSHVQLTPPAVTTVTQSAEVQELRNTCAFLKAELDRLKSMVQAQLEENKQYKDKFSQMKTFFTNIPLPSATT